jgi:hypothetical protein
MKSYFFCVGFVFLVSSHGVDAMQIVEQSKKKSAFNDMRLVNYFFRNSNLCGSFKMVSTLVRVDKRFNQEFNDAGFTRTFMRYIRHKYGVHACTEDYTAQDIRTEGVKRYYELNNKLLSIPLTKPNSIDEIKQLLHDGAEIRYVRDNVSLLSRAIEYNAVDVITFIANHDSRFNCNDGILLSKVIGQGNENIIALLLDWGVDSDTCMQGALVKGHIAIIELLFQRGANFNKKIRNGFNEEYPLVIAAENDQWNIITFLRAGGVYAGLAKLLRKYKHKLTLNAVTLNSETVQEMQT